MPGPAALCVFAPCFPLVKFCNGMVISGQRLPGFVIPDEAGSSLRGAPG